MLKYYFLYKFGELFDVIFLGKHFKFFLLLLLIVGTKLNDVNNLGPFPSFT